MDVSCIILAGGKSTRLGRNKLVEKIGEQSLLERVISTLSNFNSEIIIVAAEDSVLPQLAGYPRLKLVNDIFHGKGSLGGIYTGLVTSRTLNNLVVACDMPFLNLNLLRHMVSLVEGYDVVVPRLNSGVFEPLHAVYSRSCIPAIESLIRQNILSILELFPLINIRYVGNTEIEKFDPEHLSFFNINTEDDLDTGKKLTGKGDYKID